MAFITVSFPGRQRDVSIDGEVTGLTSETLSVEKGTHTIHLGKPPFLIVNASDMSLGTRFEFTQDEFDVICSDLSSSDCARRCGVVRVSRASEPPHDPQLRRLRLRMRLDRARLGRQRHRRPRRPVHEIPRRDERAQLSRWQKPAVSASARRRRLGQHRPPRAHSLDSVDRSGFQPAPDDRPASRSPAGGHRRQCEDRGGVPMGHAGKSARRAVRAQDRGQYAHGRLLVRNRRAVPTPRRRVEPGERRSQGVRRHPSGPLPRSTSGRRLLRESTEYQRLLTDLSGAER